MRWYNCIMNKDEFKKKALQLPLSSGVYIMKNTAGEIIYIGKAKKLKNRVKQYFDRYNEKGEIVFADDYNGFKGEFSLK